MHVYVLDRVILDAPLSVGAIAIQPDPLAAQNSHAVLTVWIPVPRLAPGMVLATQIAPNSTSALAMVNATPNAQTAHAIHAAAHMTHVILTAIQTMILLLAVRAVTVVGVELVLPFTKIPFRPVVQDHRPRTTPKTITPALV
jgi:hypothetical protein